MTLRICEDCGISVDPMAGWESLTTYRFTEGSLLIAINYVIKQHIEKYKSAPETIEIYVPPFLAYIADAVINYPESLQLLNLIKGCVVGVVSVCLDMHSSGPSAPWAVGACGGYPVVLSTGVSQGVQFPPQITYSNRQPPHTIIEGNR